ncbi:MAG TPA: asparagine synthase (glutamine-hydrolyzing) [Blastocatellia bacterium]
MCGIIGYILNQPSSYSSPDLLQSMAREIAHRGPDDEGFTLISRMTGRRAYFSGNSSPRDIRVSIPSIEHAAAWSQTNRPDLYLAHRRFAIISPTPEGHQPFFDGDNDVVVNFNGEIYNYIELRAELKAAGSTFQTATDTEVLAGAYRVWGHGCFEKLNGMWAVAIYDFRKRLLLLSRDRTGERPLYWVRNSKGIFFASEIKSLIQDDSVYPNRGVNEKAVHNFLHQAVADFDTETFFDGIESVPAATIVTIDVENKIDSRRYWRVPSGPRAAGGRSEGDLVQELKDLLKDSVELRLRADVPVNVALSGGLDSSSIVAAGAEIRQDQLDTYTVRFDEPEWNEWPYAAAVAEMHRVRNFVAEPQTNWTWDYMARFVISMEEPFHAPDLVSDHVVRRILASQGIKVSLSGIGGDELFAGYEYYRGLYAGDLKRSGHWVAGLRELLSASEKSPISAAKQLTVGRLRALRTPPDFDGFAAEAIAPASRQLVRDLPQTIEARLQADVEWVLLPYWLRAGDKSSMAIPIEVRYPFLDHRLIEFAAALPLSYLIRDGWLKWILRKAMENVLPQSVVWRRKKMGFPAPIVELLTDSLPQLRLIFRAADNPYLRHTFWNEKLDLAVRMAPWLVWRALSFELWHRHFIRGLPVLPENLHAESRLNVSKAEFCPAV